MARRRDVERLDPALVERVAGMSAGGQRWLKTAISTIKSIPLDDEARENERAADRPRARGVRPQTAPDVIPPPGLEEMLTGRASLDAMDAYPELAEELEGLGDIIGMLRSLGEERRKRGEQILRDEILGEENAPADDEDFAF